MLCRALDPVSQLTQQTCVVQEWVSQEDGLLGKSSSCASIHLYLMLICSPRTAKRERVGRDKSARKLSDGLPGGGSRAETSKDFLNKMKARTTPLTPLQV